MIKKKFTGLIIDFKHMRRYFSYAQFYSTVKSGLKIQVSDDFAKKKVLVLAPHPDDETFGCGGTIVKILKSGGEVKVVFLTDGSLGFPDHLGRASREKKELVVKREEEAKSAGAILGVKDLVFWRFHDGALSVNKTSINLMKELLSSYRPDFVFTPSFLDAHPDHMETNHILAASLEVVEGRGPYIFSYEVWTPLTPNRLVPIDKYIDKKIRAMKAYSSQLSSRRYDHAITGLNSYRGIITNVGKYAEAFFACDKDLYLKTWNLFNHKIS
jgi:LmbE family N-acetylglucosaminyl deacetylase